MRIDHEQTVGPDQKRVAVRRRTRDQLPDEIAARARLILNHDGLAELGFEAAREQTSGDVGGGGIYPMIQSGQLRPLAVASREPIDELPGVPSVSEFYPSYEMSSWQGLFVPAGTPQSVVDRLRAATNEVIAEKAFDAGLRATLSGKSYQSTPEAFAAQIKSENEKYGALIRNLNIKIQ